ncbi:unnamed protein product [Gongylonema pulchrum]|uniref:F-box domain-containing protein n=1 Tax=Gongylonema pulchrum TaxID=637853 RepID=A0A183D3D6_9BILA|nr:unnamed protein product [Gongylonema pulchrum]
MAQLRPTLRLIFSNLPLERREPLRRVCRAWNSEVLQMPATLKVERIIGKRRSFQIVTTRLDVRFDGFAPLEKC